MSVIGTVGNFPHLFHSVDYEAFVSFVHLCSGAESIIAVSARNERVFQMVE